MYENFLGEQISDADELSGMSTIRLWNGETSNFQASYKLIDDESEKQLNNFLFVVEFNNENPDQLTALINSANFEEGDYPNESRHR